eukprot:gene2480-3068_t
MKSKSTKVVENITNDQPKQQQQQQPQKEISNTIASKLADGDALVREKGLNLLSKTMKKTAFTELQYLKLWKGLFYNLWAADKLVVQDQVSTDMSNLMLIPLTSRNKVDECVLFLKAGFTIVHKQWESIDSYRLDKFYLLVRKLVRNSFQVLYQVYQSDKDQVESVLSSVISVYKKTLLNPGNSLESNGLVLHLADIFLEELHKICKGYIDQIHLTKLLLPFISFLAHSDDEVSKKRIVQRVFERLATTYSPLGIKDDYYVPTSSTFFGAEEEPEIFPTDYNMISKLFFKFAFSKITLDENRKILYSLSKKYKKCHMAVMELTELTENIIVDENGELVKDGKILDGDYDQEDGEEVDEEGDEEGDIVEDDDEIEEMEDDEEIEEMEDDEDEEEEEEEEEEELPKRKQNNNSKPNASKANNNINNNKKIQQQQPTKVQKPTFKKNNKSPAKKFNKKR